MSLSWVSTSSRHFLKYYKIIVTIVIYDNMLTLLFLIQIELGKYFKMELGLYLKYWYKVFNYQQIVKSTYLVLRNDFLHGIFSILNTTVLDVDMYARHQTSNCTGIPNGAVNMHV